MKLVREHIIFEVFSEDSDPIRDMGIGIKKQYEKFTALRCLKGLKTNDKKYIKKFFGINLSDLYFIGDSGIENEEYIKKLNNIIRTNKKVYKVKYKNMPAPGILYDVEENCIITGINTTHGKIAKLYSVECTPSIYYIGDLEAAVYLNIKEELKYEIG